MKCKFTVLDLFCGGGGFSRGFEMTGLYDIVMGIDIDYSCVLTFSHNFPNAIVLRMDIREVTKIEILKYLGDTPDIIIGSSPCEPFTEVNPNRAKEPIDRLYTDELGQLTLHFIRIVGELRPKVFILENVVPLSEEPLRSCIIKEFERIGYSKIYFNILHAEDYGTPSIRHRVFISNVLIKPKRKVKKFVTVWDAIKDLPKPGTGNIPNHEEVSISEKKLKKIAKLKWGEALYKFKGAEGMFMNYVKLHPYKPAPTVMGCSRFIHPFENRLLTVREQARLQGFPDNHVFYGSKDEQFNQVGEAVPPPLAKAIAEVVYEYLKNM